MISKALAGERKRKRTSLQASCQALTELSERDPSADTGTPERPTPDTRRARSSTARCSLTAFSDTALEVVATGLEDCAAPMSSEVFV